MSRPGTGTNGPGGPDLRVRIGDIELKNPIIAASGTFGYGIEFEDIVHLDRLGGLVVKGDRLGEFSIAGADHRWHWADAKIDGDAVIVSSPEVARLLVSRGQEGGFEQGPPACPQGRRAVDSRYRR